MSIAHVSRIALVALAVMLTAALAVLAEACAHGAVFAWSAPWIPTLGVALAIHVDALGALFGLLVTGIGALVAMYSASYVREGTGRFYLHLGVFMLAMLGLVLADDLLLLYVCWELTSISSFFLVGFHHERPEARAAARHTLLVTVMGGLCLFAGVILLAIAGESSSISTLATRGALVREHALYLPALVLVALGAFTKSAQVPFHAWLPRAMEAPTPASAYLHAATMVKAGVYLLARLSPILAGTPAWSALIVPLGVLTMVLGAARALGETRVKRILAYATVSALGILVTLLGVGTTKAVLAALVYLVAHALYKGALFLTAGALEHASGVNDVRGLRSLARAMPKSAAALALGAASMAGVPFFLGFLGKDLAYAAAWPTELSIASFVPLAALFASSALFVAVALGLTLRPLSGALTDAPAGARDPTPWLWIPPLVLALLGFGAGVATPTIAPLIAAAASNVAPEHAHAEAISLHGVTPELVLSLVTLALGVAVHAWREPLRRAGASLARTLRLTPAAGYERALRALTALAGWQTRVLQNGRLRLYVLFTVGATTALMVLGLAVGAEHVPAGVRSELGLADAALGAFVVAAALVAVSVESRFTAIAAMGAVGIGVALVFLTLGAPDLAMTQFIVEVLLVVVFVLAFYHAPALPRRSSNATRARDAVIALVFGAAMAALVLVAAETDPPERVSDWALRESVRAGHGRNVVNVILTDFRSVDTLGEITVLATAAFGVVALLRLRGAP